MKYLNRFVMLTVLQGCSISLFAAPYISSFSPAYGSAGGPTYITISGSGFLGGALQVWFNTNRDLTAMVTDQAGTQIQARVPVGATSGPITVYVGASSASTAPVNFVVIGAGPYVHRFSPTIGADNVAVTLVGANFGTVTNVLFNGKPVPNPMPPPMYDQMTVNAPSGVTSGPISVRSPQGVFTTTSNFYVPPVIKAVPAAGCRAGTNIVITGTNFLGASSVLFSSSGGAFTLAGTGLQVLSNGAVRVTVPVGAMTGKVRLIAPAGSADSAANVVIQPLITSFSPLIGGVGTPVTLFGANFNVGTPVVRFNGVSAAVSGVSFGQLTATVPGGATPGPISVQTTDGSHTNATLFYLPPSIASFTPNHAPPGSRITISGSHFLNASAVQFSGVPAVTFTVTNNSTIGATVPNFVVSGSISVTTPGGTATSASRFYVQPDITGYTPVHGLPGTNVLISGENFLDATAVKFGDANAVYTVINNNAIQATVPTGAQTGPITVVAPAGSDTTVSSFVLDYISDLSVTITNFPNPVTASNALTYVVQAGNAGPFVNDNVTVTNTLPATVSLLSANSSQGSVSVNGNRVIGHLGTLAAGQSALLSIAVVPYSAGTIENTARVTGDYPDPDLANNLATSSTLVLPQPLLSIRTASGNRVRISWPVGVSNYTLTYKNTLASADAWSNVLAAPIVVGNENTVTETNQGHRFYRLRR